MTTLDHSSLNCALDHLEGRYGVKIIHKSRDGRLPGSGSGGVAIAYNAATANFKQRSLKHVDRAHENVYAVGRVSKIKRMIVAFAIYIPPRTKAGELQSIADARSTSHKIRRTMTQPAQIHGPVSSFLYVDDTTLFCASPLEGATRHFTTQATREELHDRELERAFNNLEEAADIGMKINGNKAWSLVRQMDVTLRQRSPARTGRRLAHRGP